MDVSSMRNCESADETILTMGANSTRPKKQKKQRKKTATHHQSDNSLSSSNRSLNKIQLSLLNNGLLTTAEHEKAISAIPKTPVELIKFSKHLEQRRKYPVLLRSEFQVSDLVAFLT